MSKRHAVIVVMGLLASASALAQTETTGQAGPKASTSPAAASGTVPTAANPAHAAAPKTAAAPSSTAESRSAAALALTHEPIYDEGTAQRIKDAALSYSDLAVRGGWPTIPADAKFALGVQGANDDLLRKRLILSATSLPRRRVALSTRISRTA